MTPLRSLDLIPCVTDQLLKALAPGCQPWLQQAVDHDAEYDLAEIGEGIAARKFQLWACWDNDAKAVVGAGLTRISINKRNEKVGHDVVFAGENMSRLLPLLDRLEEFFKGEGCTKMVINGRKGWQKKLTEFRLAGIRLEKAL